MLGKQFWQAGMTPRSETGLGEAARVIAEMPAPVALFDGQSRYVAASPAWIEAFSLADASWAGGHHDQLTAYGRAAVAQAQRRALAGENVEGCPLRDGDPRRPMQAAIAARPHRSRDGAVVGAIVALYRVGPPETAVRSEADGAAELIDRARFIGRLSAALADPDPKRHRFLALAISLDNLRELRNAHGAAAAAAAVAIVGERLVSGTRGRIAGDGSPPAREADIVARFSDDQFGVLCPSQAPEPAVAQGLADRLLRLVESPVAAAGGSLRLTASVGYLVAGAEDRDPDTAMRDLDIALQRAQALGPGKAVAWEPEMTRTATRRYSLVEELRRGFDNGEFTLHYQPVLRLRDSRMVGAEALLRWNRPSEGLAPSASFVPLLEESGLIVPVGAWVLREAARQLEAWRLLYGRDIVEWTSVNLSARQLREPSTLLAAARAIDKGGVAMRRLRLECRQATVARESQAFRALVSQLSGFNLRWAIDDFGGVGLAAGDELPADLFDTCKIDPGLVGRIGSASGDKVIEALLDLARLNGAAVVAKGVETAEQRDFLRRVGCGLAQGHLFAAPMDGAQLGAYALIHSIKSEGVRAARAPFEAPCRRPPAAALNLPPSAGRLPAV